MGSAYRVKARKQNDVCKDCPVKCEDGNCAAMQALCDIYDETRTKEQRKMIFELRARLGLRDAEVAPDIQELAERILAVEPDLGYFRALDVRVGYVRSHEPKAKNGREVLGECRKVGTVYGAYLPFDFIITLYEPNISWMSSEQVQILLWHELRHITVNEFGRFSVAPHDVEDFHAILDRCGNRWTDWQAAVPDILEGVSEDGRSG